MDVDSYEIGLAAAAGIFLAAFAFTVSANGISPSSILKAPLDFMSPGEGLNIESILSYVNVYAAPFLLLVPAFSFLSILGIRTTDFNIRKKEIFFLGGGAGAIGLLSLMLFFGFSVHAIIAGIGLIAGASLIPYVAATNFAEMKRWKAFRASSNSVGKAFLVFDVCILISLVTASGGEDVQSAYSSIFQNMLGPEAGLLMGDMTDEELAEYLEDNVEEFSDLTEEEKETVIQEYRREIDKAKSSTPEMEETMAFVAEFMKSLPLIMAISLAMSAEFLRKVLFEPLGGLISLAGTRIFKPLE